MVKSLEDITHQNTITEVLPGERVHKVPLDQIDAGRRIRQVDDAWARIVADSFLEVDQLQPIDLMKRSDGQLVLIDGKHRLRAAELLGWEHIRAHIRDLDGYRKLDDILSQHKYSNKERLRFKATVRLRQIDANLIRRELNPMDRAAFLAARKNVYEALYPETKNGAQGGKNGQTNETDKMSFSKDAAEKTGLNERSIRRAVWLDENLTPLAKDKITGTDHANKQSALMELALLDRDIQVKVAALLTREEKPARTVKEAESILIGVRQGRTDREVNGDRLIALWEKCDAATRSDFLRFIAKDKLPKGWEVTNASS